LDAIQLAFRDDLILARPGQIVFDATLESGDLDSIQRRQHRIKHQQSPIPGNGRSRDRHGAALHFTDIAWTGCGERDLMSGVNNDPPAQFALVLYGLVTRRRSADLEALVVAFRKGRSSQLTLDLRLLST